MKVRNKQCRLCPWKKSTRPADIPDGYCITKHRDLEATIAEPGRLSPGPLMAMACHESKNGAEYPCVGWLAQQLGPGNNLALRLLALDGRFAKLKTVGPQHDRLEDTLGDGWYET